jgi:ribose/xylose/arabinose/galactoside ABC-type transport system permease subunit
MAATSTMRRSSRRVAASRGRLQLARLVTLIASLVALVLVIGIALTLLKANPSNGIVSALTDAARWLAGPFDGMFSFSKHRTEVAVNWGVAAVVWYLLGRLLARVIAP